MTGVVQPAAWQTAITEETGTDEFVAWTLERFGHQRIAITTQFGMEGCALIDMYARHQVPLEVIYLDTMFLFPETYELRDRLADRYPHLRFENRGTTLTMAEQESLHGPELWNSNPDLCCRLRKVEPMKEALAGVDVWITGITRRQAATRADTSLVAWDWQHQVVKISPLAGWDRARVWDYVRANDVPYNPLHERGYPSIGCTHCTRAVPGAGVADYSRAGRWSGTHKTECGLHINGSGI
jgi:phosphoadenosine phosphosulfate reductase